MLGEFHDAEFFMNGSRERSCRPRSSVPSAVGERNSPVEAGRIKRMSQRYAWYIGNEDLEVGA